MRVEEQLAQKDVQVPGLKESLKIPASTLEEYIANEMAISTNLDIFDKLV